MMFVAGGERFSSSAKARVRKGTLLGAEKLKQLLESRSVADVAHQLTDTPYARFLPADVGDIHRDRFEFLLTISKIKEAQDFLSCAGLVRGEFLKIWLEQQDIMMLKNKIWDIYSGRDNCCWDVVAYEREFEGVAFPLLDKHKLFSANELPEILGSIKDSRLVTYIEEAVKRYGGVSKTVVIGAAIDFYQNNRIFDAAKGFSGTEKDGIFSLIGVEADILNVSWIYRARKFFNMSDEMALALALPCRYRVQFDTLKLIASLPPERMHEPIVSASYSSLLPHHQSEGLSDAALLERNMQRIIRQNAIRVFQSGGFGLHLVLAYLILKEIEVMDLNVIIESVRYDFDRRTAVELLAHPLAEGW